MRKKEKEITEKTAIEAVIRKSLVCRLGLSDGDAPYIVPVCFGYRDYKIYVHGSLKGKKIDILKKNPKVCFEFDIVAQIVEAENACNWDTKYQSVIGYGRASFIEGLDEKRKALDTIMNQYSDKLFQFPENVLNKTSVIKIEIASMTGKQSGFYVGVSDNHPFQGWGKKLANHTRFRKIHLDGGHGIMPGGVRNGVAEWPKMSFKMLPVPQNLIVALPWGRLK